jgi:hypothetical protein
MKLIKVGKAAETLGVNISTLRRWEETGELLPARKSKGGTRYYDEDALVGLKDVDMPTIGYARVSSHDQKDDLVRQADLLAAFCTARGWRHEIIQDLGSGLNYRKKGSRVVVADRWFASSKTCSCCGVVKATLALSQRTFDCDDCGFEADRDHNAALNLAKMAASSAASACGEERSGAVRKSRVKRASTKQEENTALDKAA